MAKTTYKVGDKVRILDAKKIGAGFDLETGNVYPIGDVDRDGDIYVIDDADYPLIIADNELQYIEKVEESDAEMTQFKVGDKVRVIAKGVAGLPFGTVATVTKIDRDGDVFLDKCNTIGNQAFYPSYKVELVSPKPTKNQRISALEQKVEALQAEIEALKAAQKPPVIVIADAIKRYKERTPNQKRKAIIDEAKAFLVEVEREQNDSEVRDKGNVFHRQYLTKTEFIVNTEKRTVVAIIRTKYGTTLLTKGIAKCNPSDVFNADIGKAIALGRALGLDVERFEKAVQPSEIVVGHVFDTEPSGGNWTATVTKLGYPGAHDRYGKAFHHSHDSGWLGEKQIKVIDDTEAQY